MAAVATLRSAVTEPLGSNHDTIPTARQPLPSRPSSAHSEDEGKATVELASIMAIASNPVSPGPSSPPLDQHRSQDFVPPTRPSSTPFPQPEQRTDDLPWSTSPGFDYMDIDGDSAGLLPAPPPAEAPRISLNDFPAEINECILDHLFGYRVSTSSKSSVGMYSATRSWGTALRHSRRKELAELALVSGAWRILIQERLFRHIKLKATETDIQSALIFFALNPHLRPHVKHIEIWFPVFQPKNGPLALTSTSTLPTVTIDGLTSTSYIIPANNCSLEDAFYLVSTTFPEVCILTLEGGERRKAPKVRHFISEYTDYPKSMAKIPSVRTLICKGQWNLIRSDDDFETITSALPNLKEWHGAYSKPKSKAYLSMASILPRLSTSGALSLTSLNICIEGDYRREVCMPRFFRKVHDQMHFCGRLAQAAPALEHLSYTGRVCRHFFDKLVRLVDSRNTHLKSIDLTVKNCCRPFDNWAETGSGITDPNFINSFEIMVMAAIRSLRTLTKLEYLRIRYVDLDSVMPPLNPYFMLRDGWCTGVWSENILAELEASRPTAQFVELSDSFGEITINKNGQMVLPHDISRRGVISLKMSNYAHLANAFQQP